METKSNDIEIIKRQTSATYRIVSLNTEGITDGESMIFPNGDANCMNWILGHLIYIRNAFLSILGEEAVWDGEKFSCYNRGENPLERQSEFITFEELKSYFQESQNRLENALTTIEHFNPDTINDIATLSLHEIYHGGQFGYLRRILGKSGAIK